jgi:hypothetical protein
MAIEYSIEYLCPPRAALGSGGILERLKGRERARAIISLFRRNGDDRPPSQMGFEFSRSLPGGVEETKVIIVQDLLDDAAALDAQSHHCIGCPANVNAVPAPMAADAPTGGFGCIGRIDYPLSSAAERWLLDRLPGIELPLIWLLVRQGVQEMGYDGDTVRSLRVNPAYFEERRVMGRDLAEFVMSADQVFEMIFLLGAIRPSHAGVLLLFFGAIRRDLEADAVQRIMGVGDAPPLTSDEIARDYPFIMTPPPDSTDTTILQFVAFFRALHTAWRLRVPLGLDV